MNTAYTVIQIVIDMLTGLVVPFVVFCIINIVSLKTDMKWVIGGLKMLGDKSGIMLHSPHTPEFDLLIEKFWANQLTQPEAAILCGKLSAIINEDPAKPMNNEWPYTSAQKAVAIQMLAAVSAICRVSHCEKP